MLTLTRKRGESIHIGNDIVIKVINFDKGRHTVQLGIDAPKEIPVLRDEVAKRIAAGEYPQRVGG